MNKMNKISQPRPLLQPDFTSEIFCIPDAHGRCLTCSDDAQPATVLQIMDGQNTAIVDSAGEHTEVDISLLDDVIVGQIVLVHGGVALEKLELLENIVAE